MFDLKLVATIQCDHEWTRADGSKRCCVRTEKFSMLAEGISLDKFNELARDTFAAQGWQIFGGTKCPYCVEGRPYDES